MGEEEVQMQPDGSERMGDCEGESEMQGKYAASVRGKISGRGRIPVQRNRRRFVGSYLCNAAQCQKRSCVLQIHQS